MIFVLLVGIALVPLTLARKSLAHGNNSLTFNQPDFTDTEAYRGQSKCPTGYVYNPMNTQNTFDENLRVANGNIAWGEYANEDKVNVEGNTARLWFYVRDKPELDDSIEVHNGQSVKFDHWVINVGEIFDEEDYTGLCLKIGYRLQSTPGSLITFIKHLILGLFQTN